MTGPRVTVVVVSYNTRELLLGCLRSVDDHAGVPHEVIVVDNGSVDGSPEAVRRAFPEVRLLESNENRGFSAGNNRGFRSARSPYVLFLNSDAELRPGAVAAMASILDARSDVGLVGPRTLGPEGRVQVSSGPALTPWGEWRQRRLVRGVRQQRAGAVREVEEAGRREQEPDWISGSCILARASALAAVKGFDEGFFLYEEDADLCRRVRAAGFRLVLTPRAEVVHHLGRSMATAPARGRLEYQRSHLRYYAKHNGRLLTLLLRLWLLASASLAWAAALGPGARRGSRRRDALRTAAVAVFERF